MSEIDIDKIAETFKSGGIVVFPTDTAYGIGCRMDLKTSVEQVFKIRNRVDTKPLLVLADSIEMVEKYADISMKVKQFARMYWPGGVTLILPCKKELVPEVVRSGGDTLAVRIPKHNTLIEIIKAVGVPIVAPSANVSGNKTPYTLEEVEEDILTNADLVISGKCAYKKESTIIDSTSTPWKIVRQGAVVLENTNEYFKD